MLSSLQEYCWAKIRCNLKILTLKTTKLAMGMALKGNKFKLEQQELQSLKMLTMTISNLNCN